MDENTIEFARLWGQFESETIGAVAAVSCDMREYDSTALYDMLIEWNREYLTEPIGRMSTYEFFCMKLNKLYNVELFA